MKLELSTVWTAQRENCAYIQIHSHDYYELVFYCNGKGNTHLNDDLYDFTADSLAVIPPYVKHDETHEEGAKVICICFYSDLKLSPAVYTCVEREFKKCIYEILEEALQQPFHYNEMITALLAELIIKIVRNKQNVSAAVRNNFEFIISYISDNYHEKIVLRQLAEQLNISYDYFQHKFKQQTGYSPQQFLVMKRIEAAKKLLQAGKLSCTEIAYRCGFSNSAQFSAIFKRETGMTPRVFLNGNKN